MNDTTQPDSGKTMAYLPPNEVTATSGERDTDPERHVKTMPSSTEDLPPASAAPPGYELIDILGHGGMGVVYRARQTALNRMVALKMIIAGPHAAEAMLARFKAEAEAIAQLQHSNIVQIYDIGEHEGQPYFSLELVEGGSLAQKLIGHPQPPRDAGRLVEVLARAIHAAHETGIVHRDLKPANILLQPMTSKTSPGQSSRSFSHTSMQAATAYGTPKITDFGLAKNLSASQLGMTHTGSIMGTPSYMSPEQAMGENKEIGPPTDVYALGAILYECLVGRPPFRADTPLNTIMEVVRGEPVPPRRLQPKVPRDLETIALKCLEKPPGRRYSSALHLADDLQRYLDGLPITARPAGRVERAVKWIRRRPTLAALLGTVAVAVLALIGGGIWAYQAVTKRAHEAEAAHAKATEAVELGRQRLVRLCVANGARQLDAGDLLGSILWFAEGLKLDQSSPQAEAMHRKRLGATLDLSPRLVHVWAHEGPVNIALYSPDGLRILTGGSDGSVHIWDSITGKPTTFPLEHGGPVTCAAFSPDGTQAITCGPDGFAHLWDLTKGNRIHSFGVGAPLSHVAFHPDGKRVVLAAKAGGLRFLSTETGKPLSGILPNDGKVLDIALSPDGSVLMVAAEGGNVRFWDTTTYAAAAAPLKLASAVNSARYSPDGKRIATGCADGTVQVWDPQSGSAVLSRPFRHRGGVSRVAFSPDGKWLAVGSEDKTAQVWDIAAGVRLTPPMMHGSRVDSVEFSPDGRWLVTISDDNTVRTWNAQTGLPVAPILRHNSAPLTVCFSPDGRGILTGNQDGLARLWWLRPPAFLPEGPASPPADGIRTVPSPEGSLIVTFGGEPYARVRRASNREPVSPPLRHEGAVTAAAFSPSGEWLVTGSKDGTVQAWDAQTGAPRWTKMPRHASQVVTIAVSPDGKRIASGGEDNLAKLYDSATGQLVMPPIRHEGAVFHVTFGGNGETLFTASLDGTSRVWDALTGEPLTPPLPAWTGEPWRDDLRSDPRPAADLVALAQVLTGQRIDESGGREQLSASRLVSQWSELHSKNPADFLPQGSAADWHRSQAEQCEVSDHWYAAAWHLGRLAELTPSADVRRRQSRAFAELGWWEAAAKIATQAIALDPADRDVWLRRGRAFGELKRWDDSQSDLAQAFALGEEPRRSLALRALMPLSKHDLDGYRSVCRQLLVEAGQTPDALTAQWTAWACALSPESGSDWLTIVKLAEKAVAERPANAMAQTVLGAALMRAGQFDAALAKLQSAQKLDADPAAALYLTAILEKKRGRPERAKPSLEQADAAANRSIIRTWRQREELRLLRAEAE